MPENVLENLFTPYFTNKRNGNGLGLAVVKGILDRHHGSVSVQSRENNGTTFTLTFPMDTTTAEYTDKRSQKPMHQTAVSLN